MGRFENEPNLHLDAEPSHEELPSVQRLTEELQTLQQNVLKSLQEDIKRLQSERHHLVEDIQKLKAQKNNLHQEQLASEQQALLRQLVQVLANHVSVQLQSSLEQLFDSAMARVPIHTTNINNSSAIQSTTPPLGQQNTQAEHLLASLNGAVLTTFEQLQAELRNHQSNFSQQLSQMYSEQEKGEVILAELVHRLRNELEKSTSQPAYLQQEAPSSIEFVESAEVETLTPHQSTEDEQPSQETTENLESENPFVETTVPPGYKFPDTVIPNPVTRAQIDAQLLTPVASESVVATPIPTQPIRQRRIEPKETTAKPIENNPTIRVGFILVALSAIASALYNVAIRAMFFPKSQILGVFDVQQLIPPTLGNCLLILMLRMVVVVPLMLVLAPIMHPRIWQDIQALVDSVRNHRHSPNATANPITKAVLILSLISGFFLFLSQVLIYFAIGQIATGMAISLFFIYPIISGFLVWLLFKSDKERERPTLFRVSAVACICFGELLVLGTNSTASVNTSMGSAAALASGVTFAVYIVLTRICAARLHPVSFTLLNFTTMLVLCFVGLILPLPANAGVQVNTTNLLELVLTAFILGVLTLFGYVLNNIGVRKLGASRSAIIGACVPALTVIFAGFIIQEGLEILQLIGVLIVTIGAAAMSLEKIRNRIKAYRAT